MKKQYEAIWFNTDGNRHTLWPIYANNEVEAKQEALNFMLYRFGERFIVTESLIIK